FKADTSYKSISVIILNGIPSLDVDHLDLFTNIPKDKPLIIPSLTKVNRSFPQEVFDILALIYKPTSSSSRISELFDVEDNIFVLSCSIKKSIFELLFIALFMALSNTPLSMTSRHRLEPILPKT